MSTNVPPRRNEEALFWLGATSVLIYVIAFSYPYYMGTFFDTPLLSLGQISRTSFAGAFSFVCSMVLLFLLYLGAVMLSLREMRNRAVILVFGYALTLCLPLLFTYPIGAADIFGYISHGRLQAIYGLNPFVFAPSAMPTDPFFPYNAWPFETSTYGPVWGLISAALALVSRDDLWVNLLLLKGTVIVFFLGSACLIYLILLRTAPGNAVSGTILFAWNPLVLFEIAGNGHNDAVMIFLLLLATWFVIRGWFLTGIVVMTLSVLTKFATAPVLVLLIAYQARRALNVRSKSLVIGSAVLVSAITTTALYVPFWQGRDSVGFLRRADLFTSSFAAIGKLTLEPYVGETLAGSIACNLALGAFALIFVLLLYRMRKSLEGFLESAYETVFFYLVVATLWFQPWYVTWLVALGAIQANDQRRNRTVLFSLCATMSYLVWQFVLIWFWGTLGWLTVNLLAVAIVILPALAYSMRQLLAKRTSEITLGRDLSRES